MGIEEEKALEKQKYKIQENTVSFGDETIQLPGKIQQIAQAGEYCFIFQDIKNLIGPHPITIIKGGQIDKTEQDILDNISNIQSLAIDEKGNWAVLSKSESGNFFLHTKSLSNHKLEGGISHIFILENFVTIITKAGEQYSVNIKGTLKQQQEEFKKKALKAQRVRDALASSGGKTREQIEEGQENLKTRIKELKTKGQKKEEELMQLEEGFQKLKEEVAKIFSLSYEEEENGEKQEESSLHKNQEEKDQELLDKKLSLEKRIEELEAEKQKKEEQIKNFKNKLRFILSRLPKFHFFVPQSFFTSGRVISSSACFIFCFISWMYFFTCPGVIFTGFPHGVDSSQAIGN